MRYPWANTVLLTILALQLITGLAGLMSGAERLSWVLWLHGVGGYALGVLIYWKGVIIFDVFRRRWRWSLKRLLFILLTVLLLITLSSGFMWSYAGPIYLSGFSLIVLHGLAACGIFALLVWHTVVKWYVWRIPASRNRRAFMRLGGLGLAGLVLRQLAEPTKALTQLPGATRRFTGSYETGSYTGIFPATSWLFDYPSPVYSDEWSLVVDGAVTRPLRFTYEELQELATDTTTALLDCTGGFYTTQVWRGVYVARLLDQAGLTSTAQSLTVEAVSGYGRRFSLTTAQTCLLAISVADKPLTHGHGAPLRLVVPGHRGYDWVKWVARLQVNETSHLWQPPLPWQ